MKNNIKIPLLKFKLNPRLDLQMAWEFYNNSEFGGVDFWNDRAIKYHDELNKINLAKNKKQFLKKYIDKLYCEHKKEFEKRGKEIEKLYKLKKKLFFKTESKIFKNYPWPQGKYIVYLSMFDFGPRFLNNKISQVFMYDSDDLVLFTIFHKMLHFIFFDYAVEKHPKIFKKLNKDKGIFWDMSEIFNAIIQKTSDFIKIHGKIRNLGYPDHKKHIPELNKLWTKEKDIDKWLIMTFDNLK